MTYDLIIVGMGISGISAAIYAKRSNLNVLIIDKSMPGGLLNNIGKIDNFPGYTKISGPDFAQNLLEQINSLEVEIKYEEVVNILDGELKTIITSKDSYRCRRLLISIGRSQRTLNLPNEKELLGHGISTCALCDGIFYKGKDIAVVGGGNSALQETLYLSNIVNKIYLIHRRNDFTAQKEIIEKVKNTKNIEIIYNNGIKEILKKDDSLSGVILNDQTKLNIEGLFIYIGFTPKTDFISNLGITNEQGYIEVDKNMETNKKGIFASGDIIKKDIYQLITAASEGATAAINIINSLK